LSLFVTMVDEILLDDPDLESARFEILDFSCVGPKQPRTLRVIDAREIPRVSDALKLEMLEAFAEGYFQAMTALKDDRASTEDARGSEGPEADPDQPTLFD
jgi:hypothetical protein